MQAALGKGAVVSQDSSGGTMTLAARTTRAIDWQLAQSLPDAAALLSEMPPPRMRPLDALSADCDIWEEASYECRRQEQESLQTTDAVEAWARLLAWHTAYTYARFALVAPSLREAGELFRSSEIQTELRASALRLAREIFER